MPLSFAACARGWVQCRTSFPFFGIRHLILERRQHGSQTRPSLVAWPTHNPALFPGIQFGADQRQPAPWPPPRRSSATRSSGSRLRRWLLPHARAMVCASSVMTCEIIGQPATRGNRVQTRRQCSGILGCYAGRIVAFVPVIVGSGGRAELRRSRLPIDGIVVAQRRERRRADRLPHRHQAPEPWRRRRRIADAPRDDQLDLAVHVEVLKRLDGRSDGRRASGCRRAR